MENTLQVREEVKQQLSNHPTYKHLSDVQVIAKARTSFGVKSGLAAAITTRETAVAILLGTKSL